MKHEYAVIEGNRTSILIALAIASASIASIIAMGANWGASYLDKIGIQLPAVVLWPLTSLTVFGFLFRIFDTTSWKHKYLRDWIQVPDISGSWTVDGQSYDEKGEASYQWKATLLITQTASKISIFLKTNSSESLSNTAAVIPEGDAGFILSYSYANTPKPGEPELSPHRGFCSLRFSPKLETAEGKYFNDPTGRMTYGIMKLERNQ